MLRKLLNVERQVLAQLVRNIRAAGASPLVPRVSRQCPTRFGQDWPSLTTRSKAGLTAGS
jgi:hypothetical protein